MLLEASSRLGGRAFTQDLGGYPLDLGCEWLHSGDRNAWVGVAEASGFPVDRSDPPWAKAHPGIAWDEDDDEAARKAFGDWEERLRAVAQGSDCASDALEPGGEWNAYVRAIAGFMSGVAPERISATDYLAYDDASMGKNWNLPLGYGTLVATSLPSSTALRLATPAERIELTADGVVVTTGPGISSREPFVGDRRDRDLAVSIDPHGKVHYGQDHLHGDHAVAVLSEMVSDTYLAELREDGVSYLFAGPDGRDLAKAMDALGETFSVETLLLEGGAAINGAFLKAGLIDEISVLIHPAVNGLAGVESIFGYQGQAEERPGAGQALRHMSTETLEGGMVWLRYQVEKAPA